MCGIAGFFDRSGGPADPAPLGPMVAALAHRGPDGRGLWAGGPVALGHTRLRILDPTERARQPFATPDGRGVLVYNGEVYNYGELREELRGEGVAFSSTGDTEVVAHALERWGPETAVARFDGMFALAWFDRRDGSLWLARDRLGIKTLLVTEKGPLLLFASEAKALLAHPAVEIRPDTRVLALHLAHGRTDGSWTPFWGIEHLEAGTLRRVTRGHARSRRYFSIAEALHAGRLAAARERPPGGFVEELHSALADSVRLHLASDVPLATMCSGGVDSSLVTALARDGRPDLVAYVADIRWNHSEAAQARRVGEHLGVEVIAVPFDRETHLATWAQAIHANEHTCFHPSDTALLAVARRCRADGIRVLLTGEGADELFGGYPWQRESYRRWRRVSGRFWRLRHSRRYVANRRNRLAQAPLATMFGSDELYLRPRLVAALDARGELRGAEYFRLLEPAGPPADRAFLAQCLDDLQRHLCVILHRHDRMGMAASLEMRVPFLENRLIDFALHLPRRAKFHRGRSKWVVKQVASRYLPRPVVHARKKGFPAPLEWNAGCDALLAGGVLRDLMRWPDFAVAGLRRLLPGRPHLLFHLVGTEIWARLFVRGDSPETVSEELLRSAGRDENAAIPDGEG